MPLPVFITDENKQFVFANKAVQKYYGYTTMEFLKLTLDDLAVNKADSVKYEGIFLTSLVVGQGSRFKRKHKTKYGSVIDVDVEWTIHESDGKKYTISIIKDVTIYSTMGNIVLNNNQYADNKLMSLIVNTTDFLLLVLDKNYNITNCSKGYLNLHSEEVIGSSFFELYKEDINKDPRLLQLKILNTDNPIMIIENYRHVSHQDERKEKIIDIQAHYIDINANQKILVFLKDRTELIFYQENIKKMGEFNRGRNRLIILGETMAGIAHEINNPLTSILLNSQILSQKYHSPELMRITKDAMRISKIIKNLLGFSRQEPNVKTKINVKNEIEDILPILNSNMRDINLQIRIPDKAEVFGDPVEFGQVILNILKNSIDSLEHEVEKEIILTARVAEDTVEIEISDNGPGISPENIEKIYQPFFTTKDIGKGTGLGLSTVFYILEKMSGEIRVESEEKIRTTFSITLPLYSSCEEVLENEQFVPFSGKKIIIIDDDYLFLEFLQGIFNEEEALVLTESDPIRGMYLIFENEYDLLLLDADMPIFSGIEIYKTLEENGYDVSKIIVMYDAANEQLRSICLSEYSQKSIEKPFTLSVLKRYLNKTGGKEDDFNC
ncbi:MAG: hypothetical protein JM58_09050 [Peptococcaceae bacterium BICA1-8]|nr:MAG: hypothetical protein JM58_09050 [Peptococcaceae bacterium BICA1-8]